MALNDKPFEQLTEADLVALVDDQVREDRRLEYKLLVGTNDDAKKEFLKDVTAMANSAGGDLLIGVREDPPAIAAELVGIDAATSDAEQLRLENLLRDGVDPRIPGVLMRAVPIHVGQHVIVVVRVPRSLSPPHAVSFRNHWRFYGRHSSGTFPLDVPQIREAFAFASARADQLRDFRAERLLSIRRGGTPMPMPEGGKLVLHLVPLESIGGLPRWSASELRTALGKILPIGLGMSSHRTNFDGLLLLSRNETADDFNGYVQLYRTGVIEAVDGNLLSVRRPDEDKVLGTFNFESDLVGSLESYVVFLGDTLGVAPPIFVMVSLLGVEGYRLGVREGLRFGSARPARIDRPDLVIPEVVVEDLKVDAPILLRPVFDALWNAAGWEKCLDYDDTGRLWPLN